MPRRAIDREQTERELIKRLRHLGPQSRAELQNALGVSQPTVSRIIKEHKERIFQLGQTPNIKYAYKGESTWPIFEVNRSGKISELGELATIEPHHFLIANKIFSDLPYFLCDMRPSGFLGRLIPPMHPELTLPQDILLWNSLTTLKYLSHAGLNAPGNLIIGEAMAQKFLLKTGEPRLTPRSKYTANATDLLTLGEPGSSVAGEQPKFLVINEDGTHIIVKFSPPKKESVGKRMSDILICEHLAMTILRQAGVSAAKTHIIIDGDRTFLEVERFDRIGSKGRQGVLSLGALTAELVGDANSWGEAAEALARQEKIPIEWPHRVRFLELFGHLIANSDMHLFNLSFLTEHGTKLLDLAPIYDMCPMSYAPRANQIVQCHFAPPIQRNRDSALWEKALPLATHFWNEVSTDSRVSREFRAYAKQNLRILDEFA